jgi:hypothetical protein
MTTLWNVGSYLTNKCGAPSQKACICRKNRYVHPRYHTVMVLGYLVPNGTSKAKFSAIALCLWWWCKKNLWYAVIMCVPNEIPVVIFYEAIHAIKSPHCNLHYMLIFASDTVTSCVKVWYRHVIHMKGPINHWHWFLHQEAHFSRCQFLLAHVDLSWSGSRQRQVTGFCECDSETSGSVNCGEFLDKLRTS